MFEGIKLRREIKRGQQELAREELQLEIQQLKYSNNVMSKLTESRNTVVDTELEGGSWFLAGQGSALVSEDDHKSMLQQAAKMYHTNPHARAVIRGLVKFTIGKGPQVVFTTENEAVKDAWKDFVKRNKFSRKEKECGTRLFRDGEFFMRKFVDKKNGDTTVRFIRAGAVAEPADKEFTNASFGIKTDPNDVEEVISYLTTDSGGNLKETIPAKEIIHEKIFADSDQKRGVSLLRVCAKRIKQYEEWLEDRIVLNKVRSAIALVRKVDSSSGNVKKIRDEAKSDNLNDQRKKIKAFERGTVLTASKGVDYQMLSPNIAAGDAKEDGRAILLSIAAGVGFPEMIFTADFSNANYSSSLIAQNPFVKEIEEWQDFFRSFYEDLVTDVLQAKIEYGDLPADTDTTVRIEFPPMLRDDIDKLAKAFEILFKYKAISKKTWQGKMGLDADVESANMEDEEGEEVYPPVPGAGGQLGVPGGGGGSQFNNPIAPINQYGARLMEAIEAGDQEEVEHIAEMINAWDRPYGIWEDPHGAPAPTEPDEPEKQRAFVSGLMGSFCQAVVNVGVTIAEAISKSRSDVNINVEKQTPDIDMPDINVTTPDINVTTPEIKVEPTINVEAAEVNVSPPEITVEKQTPDITIEPAQVNVTTPEVKVNAVIEADDRPKRKVVERDKQGNVIRLREEYID